MTPNFWTLENNIISNKAYQGFRLWSRMVCLNWFLESWGFNALANLPDGSDLFEQQFPASLIRDAAEIQSIGELIKHMSEDISGKIFLASTACILINSTAIKLQVHSSWANWTHTKMCIIYSLSCHFKPAWRSFFLCGLWLIFLCDFRHIFVINRQEHNRRHHDLWPETRI